MPDPAGGGRDLRWYAQQLEQLMQPGGLLSTSSPAATDRHHFDRGVPRPDRAAVYDSVVGRYLHEQARLHGRPRTQRRLTLIVGPPGGGKSSALASAAGYGLDLTGAVELERDRCIGILLEHLLDHADLPVPEQLRPGLGGFRVAPAELHDVVSREGTYLAQRILEVVRANGWNLAWQHTLGDLDAMHAGLARLRQAGYPPAQALCLEADEATLQDRTYQRWAQGRGAYDDGSDPLGQHWVTRSGLSAAFRDPSGRIVRLPASSRRLAALEAEGAVGRAVVFNTTAFPAQLAHDTAVGGPLAARNATVDGPGPPPPPQPPGPDLGGPAG